MKKLLFVLSIAFYALFSLPCKASIVSVPVYMSLTGNYISLNAYFTTLAVCDSYGNPVYTFISVGSSGSNSGILQFNSPYGTAYHAIYLGDVQIDTQETYHLLFSMSYGAMSFTPTGPAYTRGFGVYFTTWDDLNNYTLGEVSFTNSNGPITGPLQIDYLNNPGTLSSFNTFCPATDATGDPSTLKLFIDFGLGHPYYQYVYYAAGDPGF